MQFPTLFLLTALAACAVSSDIVQREPRPAWGPPGHHHKFSNKGPRPVGPGSAPYPTGTGAYSPFSTGTRPQGTFPTGTRPHGPFPTGTAPYGPVPTSGTHDSYSGGKGRTGGTYDSYPGEKGSASETQDAYPNGEGPGQYDTHEHKAHNHEENDHIKSIDEPKTEHLPVQPYGLKKPYGPYSYSPWNSTSIIPTGGPTGTAPIGTAPIGTAPIGTAPIGTAPISTAPIGTAPTGTAPFVAGPTATGGARGHGPEIPPGYATRRF
ncbi:MAG: hypothetical protein M4579_000790 [Chaenotheca gracillima]|nr:MAG: hypothetical protein M4579_000790 [Chaenotheca gracillima]